MLRSIAAKLPVGMTTSRFAGVHTSTAALLPQGGPSDPGAGVGKGGGTGGSIRDAGGSFGKMEAAREEEYFRKLQMSQLKNMKEDLDREVEFHEQHIKHHQAAIERHKKRQKELENEEKDI